MLKNSFLDFYTRANGKTYHYLRLMAYHGIPLIVHKETYKRDLEKIFYSELSEYAFIEKPIIYSIQQISLPNYINGIKVICDDPIVFQNDTRNYWRFIEWYTDDEIREIINEDKMLGAAWMYEDF